MGGQRVILLNKTNKDKDGDLYRSVLIIESYILQNALWLCFICKCQAPTVYKHFWDTDVAWKEQNKQHITIKPFTPLLWRSGKRKSRNRVSFWVSPVGALLVYYAEPSRSCSSVKDSISKRNFPIWTFSGTWELHVPC